MEKQCVMNEECASCMKNLRDPTRRVLLSSLSSLSFSLPHHHHHHLPFLFFIESLCWGTCSIREMGFHLYLPATLSAHGFGGFLDGAQENPFPISVLCANAVRGYVPPLGVCVVWGRDFFKKILCTPNTHGEAGAAYTRHFKDVPAEAC